jgi:hypothetical protein
MRALLSVAIAVTITALVAASASAAPWRAAQTLTPAGETGREAAVAVAPDGTAVVAWVRPGSTGGGLRVERVAPDGTPSGSPVVLFPGDFISGVRAGVADDGTATVVWDRQRGSGVDPVESVRVSPTGQVGLPRAITPEAEDASTPTFAVAGDGSAVVAWQRTSDRAILARRIAPSGALGDVQVLEPDAPGLTFENMRAAIGAQGAVVVWTTTGFETRGARLTPSGGIAVAAKTLASSAVEPQVGVAGDGTATLAYRDFSSGSNRIVTRRFFADGGLGQPRDLSFAADDVRNPIVSVGRDGTAHVLWTRDLPLQPGRMQMRRIASDGTLGIVHALPTGGNAIAQQALATTPSGGALALIGVQEPTGARIEGFDLSAGDLLAGPDPLSAPAPSASLPKIAVGTTGAAYAAWEFGSASDPVIQGASLPAPAGASPPPAAPTPARPAPALTRFTLAPKRVLLPRRGPVPRLLIGFRVDRAASVRVAVTRRAQGRRARGRCVAPTRALIRAKARRCTRQVPVGVLGRRVTQAGPGLITVRGLRIGGRRLAPGRYRLQATAIADGARSPARTAVLTVVRGPR